MISAAAEAIIVIAIVLATGAAVVSVYCNPHGAYLRIAAWTAGAMGVALLLIIVLGAFSNSAAGLGLAFAFAALVATIAAIATMAVVAATAGHFRNRRR